MNPGQPGRGHDLLAHRVGHLVFEDQHLVAVLEQSGPDLDEITGLELGEVPGVLIDRGHASVFGLQARRGEPEVGEEVPGGTVALIDRGARPTVDVPDVRSDRGGELVEGCCESSTFVAGVDAEFVVASSEVLDERVAADDR